MSLPCCGELLENGREFYVDVNVEPIFSLEIAHRGGTLNQLEWRIIGHIVHSGRHGNTTSEATELVRRLHR